MPRDKSESHKRIIEAAKQEFLVYGYADASLRRIAAAANIQVGGLWEFTKGNRGTYLMSVILALFGVACILLTYILPSIANHNNVVICRLRSSRQNHYVALAEGV